MTKRLKSVLAITAVLFSVALSRSATACPFCAAQSQTFAEEIATMDAVVIARLSEIVPPSAQAEEFSEVKPSTFEVTQIVKGKKHLIGKQKIKAVYFGEAKLGDSFLIMGVEPPKIMWSTPLGLSTRAVTYVTALSKLPGEGKGRLEFFLNYLEDADEMIARDCYDEFARAPYKDVKALKMKMKHNKLVKWIQSPEVPASRRRLYLTMLGACGGKGDLMMLEDMMSSDDRKKKSGLDAMIGCYLTLKGADGLALIEDLFLKNKQAEYADTYAAIMALRFHGTETDLIPQKRILASMHHMLDRPRLADLVIPDLARWEDWTVMEKLVKLFKEADEKSSWVRVPVINYLRACPKPEAKIRMKELEKVDPAAVKRANTFFPFPASSVSSDKGEQADTKE
jgi:hypothetical protein